MPSPEQEVCVNQFRQVLLWPLRLMPVKGSEGQHAKPWKLLADMANMGEATPWREVVDEYGGEHGRFHERHYNEFVTFLPFVQRFLYGEGSNKGAKAESSPMRVLDVPMSKRFGWFRVWGKTPSPWTLSTSICISFLTWIWFC